MSQDFSGQNLRGRSFQSQDLTGANFSHADIRGTNFTNAILTDANFSHAKAGLPPHRAIGLVIISLFLAILSGFFSGITGSMEVFGLQAGKLTAISASFIVLTALPVFSIVTIRQSLEAAFKAAALAIALAMTLPVMLTWAGLIRGTLTGATTGILPGTMVAWGIVAGAGVFAVAIAMAGLVSLAAALLVAATGALFIAASVAEAIGFIGAAVLAGNGTSAEDLGIGSITGTASIPEFNVPIKAVAGSVAFAGATILMGGAVVAGLGVYLGWRILVEDEKYAKLHQIAVAFAAIGGTNFQGADLTDANFAQATLKSTDFREATLTRTYWFQAQKLSFARLENTYLKNLQVRKLVTTGQGQNQNFDRQDLRGVNLRDANLVNASFINTDLSKANLQQADLSRAILVRSPLENTDLTGACLTGACLENWIVTRTTKLDAVVCDYIYMRQETPENPDPNRIPHQGEFKTNEFIEFIQSILDTLDLYHDQELNSRAAVTALKNLSEDYKEPLEIVGLEKRGTGIIIKLKTSKSANHEKLKQEYYSRYKQALRLPLANQNKASLNYEFIESKVSELAELVEEIKQHPTTTIKYLYSEGIVITGGEVNLEVEQTINQETRYRFNPEFSNSSLLTLDQVNKELSYTINNLPNYRKFSSNYQTILRKLQNVIITEPNLTPEDKAEALEQVQALAEAWQNYQDEVTQKRVKIALKFLKGTTAEFPNATKFSEACSKLLPALTTLLSK